MSQYGIKMLCTVYKYVVVEAPSLDGATENPWEYAIDEQEMDQIDWEIVSVEELE